MLKDDIPEEILEVIHESKPEEWNRYNWSISYNPDSTKLEFIHHPTGLILIFSFKGSSLEFDEARANGVFYGFKEGPDRTKIADSEAEYRIFTAFGNLIEDAAKLTATQQELKASMHRWLKTKGRK